MSNALYRLDSEISASLPKDSLAEIKQKVANTIAFAKEQGIQIPLDTQQLTKFLVLLAVSPNKDELIKNEQDPVIALQETLPYKQLVGFLVKIKLEAGENFKAAYARHAEEDKNTPKDIKFGILASAKGHHRFECYRDYLAGERLSPDTSLEFLRDNEYLSKENYTKLSNAYEDISCIGDLMNRVTPHINDLDLANSKSVANFINTKGDVLPGIGKGVLIDLMYIFVLVE